MKKLNVVLTGVPYFVGMASTTRVRNLIQPLLENDRIALSNLIANKGEFLEKFEPKGNIDGVEFIYCGKGSKNIFVLIKEFTRGLRFIKRVKAKGTKNILYCYQLPDITNIPFVLFAKALRYKVIIDLVEDYSLTGKQTSFKDKIKKRSVLIAERLLPHYATSCIGINTYLTNKLKVICKGKIPVYHIPITVELKNFDKTAGSDQNSNRKEIFYGGSFSSRDGVYELIEVFDQLADIYPDLFLKITGDTGNQELKKKLVEAVEKAKNKSKIKLTGYLSYNDYLQNLFNSGICCIPRTQSEFANASFPSKLSEYLAANKPIIVSKTGEVEIYLKDKDNALLIEPGSKDELKESIIYLLENSKLADDMGKKGRAIAEKYFDSNKHADLLFNIMSDC